MTSPALDGPALSAEFNRAIARSFSSALASSQHAEQVNSAKLLSVSQLQDYDQFKGMVAGAHLKAMNMAQCPLDAIVAQGARGQKREVGEEATKEGAIEAAWAGGYGKEGFGGKEASLNALRSAELLRETKATAAACQPPLTAYDLKRDWRRLSGDEAEAADCSRYLYLLALDASQLPALMKGGAGLESLGDFLSVISRRCALPTADVSGDAPSIFGLLFHLSRVNRFALNAAAMSANHRQSARSVIDWLDGHRKGGGGDEEKEAAGSAGGRAVSSTALRFDEAGVEELRRRYKAPRTT